MPIEQVLKTLTTQFDNANVESRVAAVHWVRIVHAKDAEALAPYLDALFPACIAKISDPSEKVVSLSLEVMAKISQNEDYFARLVSSVVALFAADRGLQSARGALIIRQLSLFIEPAKILTAIAKLLQAHADLEVR